jgi:enhancing lycopene biosynthesis protein 2
MSNPLSPEDRALLEASARYKAMQERVRELEAALIDTIIMFENFERNRNMPGVAVRGQYEAMGRDLRKLLQRNK